MALDAIPTPSTTMNYPFQAEDDGDTLAQLEELRGRALVERDHATMADLLSSDLVYTHSTGVVHDKQGFLEYVAGQTRWLALEWRGQYVQCFGELAVLSGYLRTTLQPSPALAPATVEAHVLEVWRRERAAWKMIAYQATRLPAAVLLEKSISTLPPAGARQG